MLTQTTHSKSYGRSCLCEGYLEKDGTVFVRLTGWFGNIPHHMDIEAAKAMRTVLSGIIAEHDAYQASLVAEYGPSSK